MPEKRSIFNDREWETIYQRLDLSPKQREVVRHLLDGAADKQIAERMGVSVPAVRAHISRVFRKCQVDDRVDLILYVFRVFRESDSYEQ